MLQGLIVALVTPFTEEGQVDIDCFKKLIEFQLENGTKGLIVAGTTGEASTLSMAEQDLLVQTAVEVAGRQALVFAGIGGNDTRRCVERTLKVKELGASGSLAVVPYYSRPSFEGCFEHFKALSECRFPMIIYYHPFRTGLSLTPEQLAKVVKLPSVVGLKDCSGKLSYASEVMSLCTRPLFTGNDAQALPFIASGAKGLISSLANLFPRSWNSMVEAALNADIEKALALFKPMESLCEAMELESNPQGVKYAMSLMDLCRGDLRLPMMIPPQKVRDRIEKELSFLQPLVSV